MNKIILIIILAVFNYNGFCQKAINEKISVGIAKKLQDTLGLSAAEKNQIEKINKFLASRKQLAFKEFNNRDSLQQSLQRIENMRDSLYKEVLLTEKYLLYKEKKRNLINNRK